jgi:myo-inositol 2-dehydrogenase/D-chiro-inositol 1-dehydrogenase
VVADINLEAAQGCAVELGVPAAVKDYRDVLADRDVVAVAICSSTDTHSTMIKDAAASGKHIFCEKPIDFDLDRIDRALAAVDRAGVKLQIGFNRRFDPSFLRVREVVASGSLGEPHIVRITSRDPAPPPLGYVRVSGGIFLDMTIHDFDMARYLADREVEEVFAMGSVMIDPAIGEAGDVDTAIIALRFEGGALGLIDNSRRAVYGYDQRVEVFGSEGSIAADNSYPTTTVISDSASVRRDLPLNFFMERYAASYVAELRSFVECIIHDRVPAVTGADGRVAVVLALAAHRSLDEGQPVLLADLSL